MLLLRFALITILLRNFVDGFALRRIIIDLDEGVAQPIGYSGTENINVAWQGTEPILNHLEMTLLELAVKGRLFKL